MRDPSRSRPGRTALGRGNAAQPLHALRRRAEPPCSAATASTCGSPTVRRRLDAFGQCPRDARADCQLRRADRDGHSPVSGAMWGWIFIETPEGPVVLEVNPRLTTSFCGLGRRSGSTSPDMVLDLLAARCRGPRHPPRAGNVGGPAPGDAPVTDGGDRLGPGRRASQGRPPGRHGPRSRPGNGLARCGRDAAITWRDGPCLRDLGPQRPRDHHDRRNGGPLPHPRSRGLEPRRDYAWQFRQRRIRFYAGAAGFLRRRPGAAHAAELASANWMASAPWWRPGMDPALFIDVGSTTTDLVPVRGRRVMARGTERRHPPGRRGAGLHRRGPDAAHGPGSRGRHSRANGCR